MLTKTQIKEILAQHAIRPLKRLGENYLIDGNIKDKMIREARLSKDDVVLEIGPGLGALTQDLAKSGARVFAVEKDKKVFSILSGLVNAKFPNLKLFHADILKFNLKGIASAKPIKIVGNLPYYITTPVIERIIENRRFVGSALITVQREVANRLMARPGTKDYGAISCFVQYYTKPGYIYTIKRTSFYPEPEVDSSLIRLDMLREPAIRVKDEGLFFKIVRGSFNQRRKSIINSLSRQAALDLPKEALTKILEEIGIDPKDRPENLSLSDFGKISNAL